MPYRYTPCVTSETYHVFNRSIAGQIIFKTTHDYQRMYNLLEYYRFQSLTNSFSHYNRLPTKAKEMYMSQIKTTKPLHGTLLAFAIMPTHIHLVMRQEQEGGISTFMSCIQNGYAKYFNICHKRSGAMFQSMYKKVLLESEEQYLHTIRYVHLNPMTSNIVSSEKELSEYPWTSLPDYLNNNSTSFINTSWISHTFKSLDSFRRFTFDQAEYQRSLKLMKQFD